jgi:hypothetical protein
VFQVLIDITMRRDDLCRSPSGTELRAGIHKEHWET